MDRHGIFQCFYKSKWKKSCFQKKSGKNGVFFWGKDRYQQVPDSDFATLELQECSQGGLEVPIHAGPARILAAAGHEH